MEDPELKSEEGSMANSSETPLNQVGKHLATRRTGIKALLGLGALAMEHQKNKDNSLLSSILGFFSKKPEPKSVVPKFTDDKYIDTTIPKEISEEAVTSLPLLSPQLAPTEVNQNSKVEGRLPEIPFFPELHNKILALDPYSKERDQAEEELLKEAQTYPSIIAALKVVCNEDDRVALVERLQLIREEHLSDPEHLPNILTKEQRRWAVDHQIEPEVLAICLQQYEQALKLIERLQSQKELRPDLPNDIDPRMICFSPGGLAMLLTTETSKFSNIGKKSAISQLNGEFKNTSFRLEELAGYLSKDSGLIYDYTKIPGSSPGEGDLSGGAIGVCQLMPERAVDLYIFMRNKLGIRVNFFEPFSTTLALYIDSAMRWKVKRIDESVLKVDPEKPQFRTGIASYEIGVKQNIEDLAFRWNQDKAQMNKIIEATMDWDRKFTIPLLNQNTGVN